MTDTPDTKTAFWTKAHAAIREGLITYGEAIGIVRPGTRKQGYWGDHLAHLEMILKDKREERQCTQTAQ